MSTDLERYELKALEDSHKQLLGALEAIASIGGNMPDDKFDCIGGPYDAEYRGGLFVSCREIARTAIAIAKATGD